MLPSSVPKASYYQTVITNWLYLGNGGKISKVKTKGNYQNLNSIVMDIYMYSNGDWTPY